MPKTTKTPKATKTPAFVTELGGPAWAPEASANTNLALTTADAMIADVGSRLLYTLKEAGTEHAYMLLVPPLLAYLAARQQEHDESKVNTALSIGRGELRNHVYTLSHYVGSPDVDPGKKATHGVQRNWEVTEKNTAFQSAVSMAIQAAMVIRGNGKESLAIQREELPNGKFILTAPYNALEPKIPDGKGGFMVNTNTETVPITIGNVRDWYSRLFPGNGKGAQTDVKLSKATIGQVAKSLTAALAAKDSKPTVEDVANIASMVLMAPAEVQAVAVRGHWQTVAKTFCEVLPTQAGVLDQGGLGFD